MFFTRAGIIVAWLIFVLGILRVLTAFAVLYFGDQSLAPRYLGTSTTGKAIDQGQWAILVGIALGILAEISWSAAGRRE